MNVNEVIANRGIEILGGVLKQNATIIIVGRSIIDDNFNKSNIHFIKYDILTDNLQDLFDTIYHNDYPYCFDIF